MLSNYEEVIVGLFKGDLVYKRSELLNSFSRVLNMDKSLLQHVLNRNLLKLINKGFIIKEGHGCYKLASSVNSNGVGAVLMSTANSINTIITNNTSDTLEAIICGDTSAILSYKYNKKMQTIITKLVDCKDIDVLDNILGLLG